MIVLLSPDNEGVPLGGLLHLHEDGSAFVGVRVGRRAHDDLDKELDFAYLNDEWLTQEVITSLAVAAAHATNNGRTSGDAAIELAVVSRLPLLLHHGRGISSRETYSTRRVDKLPVGLHTASLDEIVGSATGLLAAARVGMTDIVQGFGLAEPRQLTAEGGVRRRYFRNDVQQRLQGEAARLGFPVLDDTFA